MSKEDWAEFLSCNNIAIDEEKKYLDYINSKEFIELTGDLNTTENEYFYLDDSLLHGKGIFARQDIKKNSFIGSVIVNQQRTLISRYTNHSYSNNAIILGHNLFSVKSIKKNSEILINYNSISENILFFKLFKQYGSQWYLHL